MAFTNQTTHYGLPQWIGSDKPTYLVDQNNAYQTIDSEIYNANVTAGEAVTTANGASSTAGAASATAADALSAAQTASTTADSALTAAQDAGTIAQAAQTAAGAAQTAAEAAQTAAAGNSITNLAPAYDSTITYAIDDLVTQDGKLYKCIVAVTSPEQFDINKWDDVTTSEIYARAGDYYTKAQIDANHYTKTQSDARYTKTTVRNVSVQNTSGTWADSIKNALDAFRALTDIPDTDKVFIYDIQLSYIHLNVVNAEYREYSSVRSNVKTYNCIGSTNNPKHILNAKIVDSGASSELNRFSFEDSSLVDISTYTSQGSTSIHFLQLHNA